MRASVQARSHPPIGRSGRVGRACCRRQSKVRTQRWSRLGRSAPASRSRCRCRLTRSCVRALAGTATAWSFCTTWYYGSTSSAGVQFSEGGAGAELCEWRNSSVSGGEVHQDVVEKSTGFAQARYVENYRPRVVDAELAETLSSAGALPVQGARATGTTESARRLAASELRLDSAEPRALLAREQPATALPGDAPRLLDEWQLVPGLWNEARHAVDDRNLPGQFILAGSASPDRDPLRHSGAGRFRHVLMRTMTFAETGHATGAVSLRGLFDGPPQDLPESQIDFPAVVNRLVVGGWPGWSAPGRGGGSGADAVIRGGHRGVRLPDRGRHPT